MKALIFGITGMDGSYLAELLLEKGYEVYGFIRRCAIEDQSKRYSRINHILDKITILYGSLESYESIYNAINKSMPDEIYQLAAQSYVSYSFDDEHSTMKTNIDGTHNILHLTRMLKPDSKIYFAGSSEMFGKVLETPQNENTPFNPRSIYGITKCCGFYLTKYYRECYNMFCCSGILFNHEGERRGYEFVTRKITNAVARIKVGLQNKLELGNLDAKRDWGYSKDYVKAIWLMLQQEKPDDYVIATGEMHTVREFCKRAFERVGLNYEDYVVVNPSYYRPNEVDVLLGNYAKAKEKLGWKPDVTFNELVDIMVGNDMRQYDRRL